jgi:glycosyltransferase involved in cell wall biosynthesis
MNDIQGLVTNLPQEDVISQKWDIVLYNRFSPFDGHLDECREKLGAKIVVDLDDDWILPANHINYYHYLSYRERLERNIREADLVTCTNDLIADKVVKLNKNVEVIPNGIPFGEFNFTLEREPSDKVRIFWCGSVTHEPDISILKGPIRRLAGENVKMVMGGYNDSNETSKKIWDRMASTFTNAWQMDYLVLKGCLPDVYMEMYRHADIGLIPLEHGTWHAGKSNLKVLECASKKIPVIVSHVPPYTRDKDAPILWVRNQKDWYKHIKTLIHDKEKREDLGEQLYQWAYGKFNLADINKRRREIFERLIQA